MTLLHTRWVRTGSAEDDAVLAHAGRELARYVEKLSGEKWDARGVSKAGTTEGTAWLGLCDALPASPGQALTPAPWDDGYAIWADAGNLFIAGRNARSVLFGVYAFLETQGVRFLRPGRAGEVIPQVDGIVLPATPIVDEARHRHRGVCIEGAPSIEHALDMVDWCAKRRLNTIFLQFLSSRYFYNNWYERTYNPKYADHTLTTEEALALDERLIVAMKPRGLIFHRVGHGWTSATCEMPRSGWVKADEPVQPQYARWLAEVKGERKIFENIPINTELCYSFQPAFDAFVETVVGYAEAHPEMDVVHVWLSDATNNKCECAECQKLHISDWYAKIINALSEALHRRAPKTRFVFLCYFELIWAPRQVQVDDRYGNAILMFAPIARCYGHALTDPACDDGEAWPRPLLNQYAVSHQNAFYGEVLAEWRKAFGGDSFDFDYHLMWANWRQLTDTGLARILHEDLQHLKADGLDGIISCQSFRVFYPSGLGMATLAECLWNPDVPWGELRQRYLEAAYGADAAFAGDYLDATERFLRTDDPHLRAVPLSDAAPEKLAEMAAFLDSSLVELTQRQEAASDGALARSLELLAHHARLLQFLVKAHQAQQPAVANQQLDRAAAFLRRTEPRLSASIDTMLALRLSVDVHRPAA
jgi:hypothetical protein